MLKWGRDSWLIRNTDELVDLFLNTPMTIREIAEVKHMSYNTVWKHLQLAGCNTSHQKPTYWNEERIQYIIDHYKKDDISSIASHFGKGMTNNAISHQIYFLRKKGLLPPVNHRKRNDKV